MLFSPQHKNSILRLSLKISDDLLFLLFGHLTTEDYLWHLLSAIFPLCTILRPFAQFHSTKFLILRPLSTICTLFTQFYSTKFLILRPFWVAPVGGRLRCPLVTPLHIYGDSKGARKKVQGGALAPPGFCFSVFCTESDTGTPSVSFPQSEIRQHVLVFHK